MGYMGLGHYNESDTASDTACVMCQAVVKALKDELKVVENGFNTSGPENVAMIFETFICPADVRKGWADDEDIVALAKKVISKLDDTILDAEEANWAGDYTNKKIHLDAYRRSRRRLRAFVKFAEEM